MPIKRIVCNGTSMMSPTPVSHTFLLIIGMIILQILLYTQLKQIHLNQQQKLKRQTLIYLTNNKIKNRKRLLTLLVALIG